MKAGAPVKTEAARARRVRGVIFAALCALALAFGLAGCAQSTAPGDGASQEAAEANDANDAELVAGLRIASMKGPTSVGLAAMMQETDANFTVVAAADEVAALFAQRSVDIACVPANLAATLYQKTDGALRVLDVNTLGVLNVMSADMSITSVADLAGRTVYMTGKGTVPEYTFAALLSAAGLSWDDVDVQFKSEPSEVAALLAQDSQAAGILPQPYATALEMKNVGVSVVIDMTVEWNQVMGSTAGSIVTGVTVASAGFVEEHPDEVAAFLRQHALSAQAAVSNPSSIVETVVSLGIIENAELAEAAIPQCSVVCLTSAEMKEALSGYLQTLYEQNPASVGGALPGDDFYYVGNAA